MIYLAMPEIWILSLIGLMMIIVTVYFAVFFMIFAFIGFGMAKLIRPIFIMLRGRDHI